MKVEVVRMTLPSTKLSNKISRVLAAQVHDLDNVIAPTGSQIQATPLNQASIANLSRNGLEPRGRLVQPACLAKPAAAAAAASAAVATATTAASAAGAACSVLLERQRSHLKPNIVW